MGDTKVGLVGGIIAGIGGLLIIVIITLVITSTLLNSNLLRSTEATSQIANESGADLTDSTYTLALFNSLNRNYAVSQVYNATDGGGELITSPNYTFDSATGVIQNATAVEWGNVNITYSYTGTSQEEITSNSLQGNLTGGIDNVSTKLPTILLIGAVVLLFGVIVFLVRQSQQMGIGGSSGSL